MAAPRFRESRRKPLAELKRPRRRLGEELRPLLNCPVCIGSRVDVIRWGERTTRFACEKCGLRFSLDLGQLARTLREPATPDALDSIGGMYAQATLEMKAGELAEGGGEEIGERIERLRHVKPEGQQGRQLWPPKTDK